MKRDEVDMSVSREKWSQKKQFARIEVIETKPLDVVEKKPVRLTTTAL